MPRDVEFEYVHLARRRYVGPPPVPLGAQVEAQIARFRPELRRRLRRFAKVSKPCADLLISFPAAAALIASEERGAAATGAAVAAVKAGASLDRVGEIFALPRWMRRLSPEAFRKPLEPVAFSDKFHKRIGNALPTAKENAAMWLDWVIEAERLAHEEFALWIAAQPIFDGNAFQIEAIELLAAFAWASTGGRSLEDPLLVKPWNGKRPLQVEAKAAADWVRRLAQTRCAKPSDSRGWSETLAVSGYKFSPRRAEELSAEGEIMRNCLATYVPLVEQGVCAVFAMRRGGRAVASLELRPGRDGEATLIQAAGPDNAPLDAKQMDAVRRWMARLGPCPLSVDGTISADRLDGALWRRAWAPYLKARPAASAFWAEASGARAASCLRRRLELLAWLARWSKG